MWVWIVAFILCIAAACMVGVAAGRAFALDKQTAARKYLKLAKLFLFGYFVFNSCFVFPFRSDPYPLDLMKIYLVAATCGIIGLGLAITYGKGKEGFLYPAILLLTALGMGCRYVLEYGEVSNSYNFTAFNMVSFLAVIPVLTTVIYHFAAYQRGKGRNQ